MSPSIAPRSVTLLHSFAYQELRSCWRDIGLDPNIYVGIVTGAGHAFCGGRDVKFLAQYQAEGKRTPHEDPNSPIFHWGGGGQPQDVNLEKPLIAAVNGFAVGVGLNIVLQCQLRVMADDAWLGDQHTNVGRLGAPHEMYNALPRATAAYLTLCNGRLTPQECLSQVPSSTKWVLKSQPDRSRRGARRHGLPRLPAGGAGRGPVVPPHRRIPAPRSAPTRATSIRKSPKMRTARKGARAFRAKSAGRSGKSNKRRMAKGPPRPTDDAIARIIDAIYAAAVTPERWSEALAQLRELFGASFAALVMRNADRTKVDGIAVGVSHDDYRGFLDTYYRGSIFAARTTKWVRRRRDHPDLHHRAAKAARTRAQVSGIPGSA